MNRKPVLDPTGVRRRILEYLAANGPVWGESAAEALGLTPHQWWEAAGKCPWFTFDAPGRAGWTLTPEGREVLDS